MDQFLYDRGFHHEIIKACKLEKYQHMVLRFIKIHKPGQIFAFSYLGSKFNLHSNTEISAMAPISYTEKDNQTWCILLTYRIKMQKIHKEGQKFSFNYLCSKFNLLFHTEISRMTSTSYTKKGNQVLVNFIRIWY